MNPLIIYHANCYDGFTAAWIAKEGHQLQGVPNDYHPAKYGEPPPDCAGRDTYILDFSYPREQMEKIAEAASALTVLDHHKTAEEALRDFGTPNRADGKLLVRFDMERSGAGLAWDFFIGGEPHRLVQLVEDRDLWRFRYGDDTRHAHAYLASLPMTFDAWDEAFAMPLSNLTQGGKAIRRYIDAYCEKAAQEARRIRMDGHLVACVNVPYQNASEMADVLLRHDPQCVFSAGWFQRADGRVQFSLRSRGDFDVSEVAKRRGGGGHKGAAGFDLSVDEAWRALREESDAV